MTVEPNVLPVVAYTVPFTGTGGAPQSLMVQTVGEPDQLPLAWQVRDVEPDTL